MSNPMTVIEVKQKLTTIQEVYQNASEDDQTSIAETLSSWYFGFTRNRIRVLDARASPDAQAIIEDEQPEPTEHSTVAEDLQQSITIAEELEQLRHDMTVGNPLLQAATETINEVRKDQTLSDKEKMKRIMQSALTAVPEEKHQLLTNVVKGAMKAMPSSSYEDLVREHEVFKELEAENLALKEEINSLKVTVTAPK